MGKKKSVVFTILFTIVIAVLCAMCVVPTFTLPFDVNGSVKDYQSVLSVMSLDSDLGGGYYTIYYPEGVISESEYNTEYAAKAEVSDKLAAEYAADYTKHGSIYLEKDIVENGDADSEFKEEFNTAVSVVCDRYEALNLDYVKIDVLDDYSIRVELSSLIADPDTVFSLMSYTGEFTLRHSSKTNPMLPLNKVHTMDEYFKKVSVRMSGETPYVRFRLTSAGQDKLETISNLVYADENDKVLNFYVGENSVVSLTVSGTIVDPDVYVSGYSDELSARCVASLINSCINNSVVDLTFTTATTSTVTAVVGEDSLNFVYIGLGVVVLAMVIFSVIKFRGIGVAHVYGFLSYLVAAVMCVGLIDNMFLSLGGILAIVFGGILLTVSNYYMFGKIKEEFDSGKRIVASVKEGYKKCLAPVIDMHVVLLAAALLMYFIGISAVSSFGVVLALCTGISAIASLVMTRFYFAILMGCAKNQFKFCNFKREVIDDED